MEAPKAFEGVNECFERMVRRCNVWRIVQPTLDAAGLALDEAAYMNFVPYRTWADKTPPVAACRAALKQFVEPAIALLAPKAIIALGKKAGKIQDIWLPNMPLYCIRRTIGDSYVHPEAMQTFADMRRELT